MSSGSDGSLDRISALSLAKRCLIARMTLAAKPAIPINMGIGLSVCFKEATTDTLLPGFFSQPDHRPGQQAEDDRETGKPAGVALEAQGDGHRALAIDLDAAAE